jgi:hypothetical protein
VRREREIDRTRRDAPDPHAAAAASRTVIVARRRRMREGCAIHAEKTSARAVGTARGRSWSYRPLRPRPPDRPPPLRLDPPLVPPRRDVDFRPVVLDARRAVDPREPDFDPRPPAVRAAAVIPRDASRRPALWVDVARLAPRFFVPARLDALRLPVFDAPRALAEPPLRRRAAAPLRDEDAPLRDEDARLDALRLRDPPLRSARREVRRPSDRACAVSRPMSLLKLERSPPAVLSS